jgi:hypothetical protein
MSSSEERRPAVRGALHRADGAGVVSALAAGVPDDLLQLAGDGLLLALAHQLEQAAGLARRCVGALRARGWEGDDELAEQLEVALGLRPPLLLRPLPVDLEELAGILEGDPAHGDGRIDLHTGEVWPQAAIEYARETVDEDDPDRGLAVLCEGSAQAYRDLEDFIDTIEDDDQAEQLTRAITGRGAFRRFKDTLACSPGELERYYNFSDERQRGRARAWLHAAGYTPRPRTDALHA